MTQPIPNEVFIVIDDEGGPFYSAGWEEACHEHINEAIGCGIVEAKNWVVRRYVLDHTSGDSNADR